MELTSSRLQWIICPPPGERNGNGQEQERGGSAQLKKGKSSMNICVRNLRAGRRKEVTAHGRVARKPEKGGRSSTGRRHPGVRRGAPVRLPGGSLEGRGRAGSQKTGRIKKQKSSGKIKGGTALGAPALRPILSHPPLGDHSIQELKGKTGGCSA